MTNAAVVEPEETERQTDGPRMWRAAWRQHRWWVIGSVLLVALGGVVLIVVAAITPECVGTEWWIDGDGYCDMQLASNVAKLFRAAMLVVPIMLGALLGAVAFGPDSDNRTRVYALSQSVGRVRWWATKVAVCGIPVALALVAVGLATLAVVSRPGSGWIWDQGRVDVSVFPTLGLIPATRFLVAFAAAALIAAVWRTLAGIVGGLVVAAAIAVGSVLLQPLVVQHQRVLTPIDQFAERSGVIIGGDALIEWTSFRWSGYADADGRQIDAQNLDCRGAGTNRRECLRDNGVAYRLETYVPDSEYPRMMLTIGGIELLIAAGLLGAGGTVLRRRDL